MENTHTHTHVNSQNGIPKPIKNLQKTTADAKVFLLLLPWPPRVPQAAKIVPQGAKMKASGLPNNSFKHQKMTTLASENIIVFWKVARKLTSRNKRDSTRRALRKTKPKN